MEPIKVFIETGKKRTFASALDWPGWSRPSAPRGRRTARPGPRRAGETGGGRDEGSALQALADYGPRYAQVIRHIGLEFQPPLDASAFVVVERLEGDATTDFGAPSIIASADKVAIDRAEYERLSAVLQACWQAFDRAVRQAEGKELRKGPRGGGRGLEKIMEHVLGAEQGYLRSLAWKAEQANKKDDLGVELRKTRKWIIAALETASRGELPKQGPRGGKVWPPRYFVRRVAWHALDHAWEIEDRII